MKTRILSIALAATATVTFSPAAFAQNEGYNSVETQTTTVREEEDRDFPWGLLGLLGLAGLLGRKRKEADIHVDARRDTRP